MKATIYIPEELMSVTFTDALVEVAGGCTVTGAMGYWKDKEKNVVAIDDMLLVSVIFDRDDRHAVRNVLADICASLHRDGEQEVLIETMDGTRYSAQFVEHHGEVVVW